MSKLAGLAVVPVPPPPDFLTGGWNAIKRVFSACNVNP
jgi:hypothetical protein